MPGMATKRAAASVPKSVPVHGESGQRPVLSRREEVVDILAAAVFELIRQGRLRPDRTPVAPGASTAGNERAG